MQKDKQMVAQHISTLEYELDGLTLQEAIKLLQSKLKDLKTLHPNCKDFTLDYSTTYNDRYSDDTSCRLNLLGMREESDAEYIARTHCWTRFVEKSKELASAADTKNADGKTYRRV
jgi:hypothetical protein